mmetsp:Transcript_47636/g.152646  ORF Transcript_47636/g.152646 Transcript_47636/m.152646 type:complete len:226 (-) Transcript_47636:1886-2563(-)
MHHCGDAGVDAHPHPEPPEQIFIRHLHPARAVRASREQAPEARPGGVAGLLGPRSPPQVTGNSVETRPHPLLVSPFHGGGRFGDRAPRLLHVQPAVNQLVGPVEGAELLLDEHSPSHGIRRGVERHLERVPLRAHLVPEEPFHRRAEAGVVELQVPIHRARVAVPEGSGRLDVRHHDCNLLALGGRAPALLPAPVAGDDALGVEALEDNARDHDEHQRCARDGDH